MLQLWSAISSQHPDDQLKAVNWNWRSQDQEDMNNDNIWLTNVVGTATSCLCIIRSHSSTLADSSRAFCHQIVHYEKSYSEINSTCRLNTMWSRCANIPIGLIRMQSECYKIDLWIFEAKTSSQKLCRKIIVLLEKQTNGWYKSNSNTPKHWLPNDPGHMIIIIMIRS